MAKLNLSIPIELKDTSEIPELQAALQLAQSAQIATSDGVTAFASLSLYDATKYQKIEVDKEGNYAPLLPAGATFVNGQSAVDFNVTSEMLQAYNIYIYHDDNNAWGISKSDKRIAKNTFNSVDGNLIPSSDKAIDTFFSPVTFSGKPLSKNVMNPALVENIDKSLSLNGLVTESGYYTSQYIEWGENTHAATTRNGAWEQYDENFNRVDYYYASPTDTIVSIQKNASAKYVRISILTQYKNTDGLVFISANDASSYELLVAAYSAGKDEYSEYVKANRSGTPIKFDALTTQKIEKTNTLPVESKTIYNEVFPDQTDLVTISKNVFNPYYKEGEGFRIAYPNQTGVDFYTCDLIEWGNHTELRLVQCAGHCQYTETFEEVSKAQVGYTDSVITITKAPSAKYVRVSVPNDYRYSVSAVLGTLDDYNTFRKQPFKIGSNQKSKLDYPVADFTKLNQYRTIEDFQREQNVGMALVGNIIVKSNKEKHDPISNTHTMLDYDIVNFERLKPGGGR